MTATDAGPEVELYIPHQRRDSPLTFLAGHHRDTPAAELLDEARYCTRCGHCICKPCQTTHDTSTKEEA